MEEKKEESANPFPLIASYLRIKEGWTREIHLVMPITITTRSTLKISGL